MVKKWEGGSLEIVQRITKSGEPPKVSNVVLKSEDDSRAGPPDVRGGKSDAR